MKSAIKVLTLVLALALVLTVPAFADEDRDEARAAEYLREYYGITFDGDVTVDAFNDALAALGVEPVEAETLTLAPSGR